MSGDKTKRYLFDTNAVVSLLRGDPALLELTKEAEWVGISVITHIEFLAFPRMTPEDIAVFGRFEERVAVVDLNHDHSTLIPTAIALRQHQRLKLPDAVVAASAIVNDAVLVTADRKLLDIDGRVNGLQVRAFS